jgi:hypothetical protein
MCLLAARSAVSCKRTGLPLAWGSSHQPGRPVSLLDRTNFDIERGVPSDGSVLGRARVAGGDR